ncbi:metallophosphoesterase [Deinococcus hohokamensis]|uniref:Metallophosphoesterase n=1 Tax=Deinococcus hohokamensis TaxID=309883 RepID=A0ABV9IDY2_9DEIO
MRAVAPLLLALLLACAPRASTAEVTLARAVARLPAPHHPDHVRVVVMGDQGTGTSGQRQVAAAMGRVCHRDGCDLGVGLGDNFYPAGPKDVSSPLFRERFADVYSPLKVPFAMVPGNHDESWLNGGDGADARGAEVQVAYSAVNPQWVMPGRQYRAPVGPLLELFAVDTTPLATYAPGLRPEERPGGSWARAQQAWLSGGLGTSRARWKLVLGHHPLFSNGKHGDAGSYDQLPLAFQRGGAVRDLYGAACGKADLLLSGHDHALELFAPQPECPGTWTAVSGAAGKAEGARRGTRPAAFEVYGQLGFVWLDVTPAALTLRFYTVGADGRETLAHTETLRK